MPACSTAPPAQKAKSGCIGQLLLLVMCALSLVSGQVLWPQEFAGLADGGKHRLACVDGYVLYTAASSSCVKLNSSVPEVEVEQCHTAGNTTLLVIHHPQDQRMVFSTRLIGRQVVMLRLSSCQLTTRLELTNNTENDRGHCDGSTPVHTAVSYGWVKQLLPGRYGVHIQLLYRGFSLGKGNMHPETEMPHREDFFAPPKTVVATTLDVGPATLDAPSAPSVSISALEQDRCPYCRRNRAAWGVCKKTFLQGSWLTRLDSGNPQQQPLLQLPQRLASKHDARLLHWQPLGCHLMPLRQLDLEQCLAQRQRHVCFIGDSQTRFLHNGFVDQVQNPNNMRRLEAGTEEKKEVLKHERVTYFPMFFGEGWKNDDELESCTDVFINFGHWPLSFQPPARWALQHYLQALKSLLVRINTFKQQHPQTTFYWLMLNPTAKGVWHIPCADFRTHPFIELFNAAANRLVSLHGIPIVNTYSIAQPLYDLSYDNFHYHWYGSVGRMLNTLLANIVCVQQR